MTRLSEMNRAEVLQLRAEVDARVRQLKRSLECTLPRADFLKVKADLDYEQNLSALISARLSALKEAEKRENRQRELKRNDDYRGRFVDAARRLLPPDVYARICKEAE